MSKFSSGVWREHALPVVNDSDPQAVHKVAELLGGITDFQLPGFGIETGAERQRNFERAHMRHQGLILAAVKLAVPKVVADPSFAETEVVTVPWRSPLHVDLDTHLPPEGDHFKMIMRLHTSDIGSGSRFSVMESRPGIGAPLGDGELFARSSEPTEAALAHGYEPDYLLRGMDASIERVGEGEYNPVLVDPNVYHFDLKELDSVFFRLMTSTGPVAVHNFEGQVPDQPRTIAVSDLTAYSY